MRTDKVVVLCVLYASRDYPRKMKDFQSVPSSSAKGIDGVKKHILSYIPYQTCDVQYRQASTSIAA
jgi:hypothetical protein